MRPSVLILSNQFPPVNGTGARRPYYLARQLADEGHRVSVLSTSAVESQAWLPDVTGIAVHTASKKSVQRDTNALQRALARAHERLDSYPGHGPLRLLADLILPEGHLDRWDTLPHEVETLVGKHDIVLATCPSWYHFRLAAQLAKRWGAMFIADYRDPWTVHIGSVSMGSLTNYGTGLAGRLRTWKMRRAERKWPGQAFAITAATGPFLENALRATGVERGLMVHGGFDPSLLPVPHFRNDKFTLVYTGRLYDGQDWGTVLDAIDILRASAPDLDQVFRLDFHGAVSADSALLQRLKDAGRVNGVIQFLPRSGREDALMAQQHADALLNVSMDLNNGWLPVKFLEYLGAGRPIILCVKSNDLTVDVVQRTRTGTVTTNATELAELLTTRLNEWRTGAEWRIDPDRTELNTFNYAYQMRIWTAKLREWFMEFQQKGAS